MSKYVQRDELQVASELADFIRNDVLPDTQVDEDGFWRGFTELLKELCPQNKALLAERDSLQKKIDQFHQQQPDASFDTYKAFLQEIGYLQPVSEGVSIDTDNVDAEVALTAGPQLVVPINNARYALNAANARWGSLYDAAYGTDVIDEKDGAEKTKGYNPIRGQKVIEFGRTWLDTIAPLKHGSHKDSKSYHIADGHLTILLNTNEITELAEPEQFVGYQGELETPSAILLRHNGLHAEIQVDTNHPVGKTDPAGVKDILLESAVTTIMDCEDSVAAVDAEDKTLVYRNWLGLMKGTLEASITKSQRTVTRTLNPDRIYSTMTDEDLALPGRSLMFVRNVGHLMTSDAILFDGDPIPEGIMDAVITSLIAKHDLLGNSQFKNSRTGSVYIVKPKMHGPKEVAFSDTLFAKVEALLDLEPNTLKMGIMDEERRTSVNLAACIAAAKHRVVFINTGFLDRTGDEIHTSMLAGPFALKAELKQRQWIEAYEKANVITGLACGLKGKAQIGKGMWPIPDNMADMMATKSGHPMAGANTAWVPSPTAATLHALHYHQISVQARQSDLSQETFDGLDDILQVPLMEKTAKPSAEDIQRDVENNVQGILGYVVRWVHQGVGCSKVPDINNVGLMEDRATLRISSQHLANWLKHGVITKDQVNAAMLKMAALVDGQNEGDREYIPMMPDPASSIAYQAAQSLIFEGDIQPNGYTEPVLHAKRREMKAKLAQQ